MSLQEYLHHKFIQTHSGVKDDDLPDTYDLWYDSLTVEDLIKYNEEYEQRQSVVN